MPCRGLLCVFFYKVFHFHGCTLQILSPSWACPQIYCKTEWVVVGNPSFIGRLKKVHFAFRLQRHCHPDNRSLRQLCRLILLVLTARCQLQAWARRVLSWKPKLMKLHFPRKLPSSICRTGWLKVNVSIWFLILDLILLSSHPKIKYPPKTLGVRIWGMGFNNKGMGFARFILIRLEESLKNWYDPTSALHMGLDSSINFGVNMLRPYSCPGCRCAHVWGATWCPDSIHIPGSNPLLFPTEAQWSWWPSHGGQTSGWGRGWY